MAEKVVIGNAELWHGDCLDVLRTLPDCSVDSIVSDPPYGLTFMGKRWGVDCSNQHHLDPVEFQLALTNQGVLAGMGSSQLAPGYGSRDGSA